MSVGGVGSVISLLTGLMFTVLALATLRQRRVGREARDRRQMDEINIAAMAYVRKVRMAAAINGWELPPLPRELTPEYVLGKAADNDNDLLKDAAGVLGQLNSLGGGQSEDS